MGALKQTVGQTVNNVCSSTVHSFLFLNLQLSVLTRNTV